MGGDDAKDIVKIFFTRHALARWDRLAEDEFLAAVVEPRLKLDFAVLKQPATDPPATQTAGDLHHVVL